MAKMAKMVAPYWSDVDTRCGGDVWYRIIKLYSSDNLFKVIQHEVGLHDEGNDFEPTSAVFVTWEGVTCTNNVPCTDQRVSSYHSVLYCVATDSDS